jgi:hypothetical protein
MIQWLKFVLFILLIYILDVNLHYIIQIVPCSQIKMLTGKFACDFVLCYTNRILVVKSKSSQADLKSSQANLAANYL